MCPDDGYLSMLGRRTYLCFILVSSSQPDYLVFHLFLGATGLQIRLASSPRGRGGSGDTEVVCKAAKEEEGRGEEASPREKGGS